MKKRISQIVIFLFISLLLLPLFQQYFHLYDILPIQENRKKAQRPDDYNRIFSKGNIFQKRYEAYFNDVYGFRDFLIRLKNQIDYTMYSKSDELFIGRDHFLFYKSVVETEEPMIDRHLPEDYEKLFTRLSRLNSYLKRRGITLIIVPIPMKNTIYPEMMPPSAPWRPKDTGFQKLRAFLGKNDNILSIDVQHMLSQLKIKMPVYHKTDFHWNDPAGFFVAKRIVDLVGSLSGNATCWRPELKIKQERFSGGQNNSLAVFFPYISEELFLFNNSFFEKIGKFKQTGGANQWEYRATPSATQNLLPCTVVFGDSYADAFNRTGFLLYFSELYKFYNWEFKDRFHLIPKSTKFIIIEFIEVVLNGMLNDAFWPDLETASGS